MFFIVSIFFEINDVEFIARLDETEKGRLFLTRNAEQAGQNQHRQIVDRGILCDVPFAF